MSYEPHSRPHFHMQRPPWWPENQPWPPPGGRYRHNPFFRRLGCFFGFLSLAGFIIFVLLVALILRLLLRGNYNNWLQWSIPLGVAALVLGIAMVMVTVRGAQRISAPLDDLHEAAEGVARGDYSMRVAEKGTPEVRSLARAFNDMASRLSQADEQRRNLLADTTHELLSPLTVIQGNLEGMLDGVYPADEANLRAILDETNILSRLIEDLRTLALAERGALQLKKEPTELLPFLGEVASAFQSQADAMGVTISVKAADGLPAVEMDAVRMRQVLANLLANSLRYSPMGGTIWVRCESEGGNIQLTIQDEGPGIAADDLEQVFVRFYKSTDSGGMGLGLAIAKHLVEAHGGKITAENAPNKGTIMRISLPIAA